MNTASPRLLGLCCSCRERPATGLAFLNVKAPVPGTGWGCLVCHLPRDGAVAALCDECGENESREIVDVVAGLPALGNRAPRSTCTEAFEHRQALHDRDQRRAVAREN